MLLQPLFEIVFGYHKFFFRVLGPPYKQNENFKFAVLGIKIGLKRVCWVHLKKIGIRSYFSGIAPAKKQIFTTKKI